ncbi:phage tail tape measure protein [Microbacterium maritypicum]
MALRAAEIESLFTADLTQIAKAEKTIKDTGERIEKKPIKVDADATGALDGMDQVEEAAKRLVSKDTIATVNANIERGEKNLERVQKRLDYLRSVETDLDVKADISRAEASLSKVSRNLDGLKSARATMEVDADTSAADSALEGVKGKAGEAGEDSGEEFGASIIAALATIPIAGAVIGIGAAAGKALIDGFNDGLQIEVGFDRLEALTGVSPADALRLGRAAGEAYANVFGESIESNMDTTRLALQFDILDADATTRDAQLVIQGLSGIADVLGEDVEPVARAVAQMLRTGVASSAQQAFDILATGAREGVNIGEDLLDTFNEYGTQFRKLGLDGAQSLGLLSQGLRGGARDSDVVADALKELAIRATDPGMKEGFEAVGFSWDDLSQRIAQGGPEAAAALDETLDRIRAFESPAEQAAAAAALFGTQSEDMAGALLAMDLSTAVDQLNGVTGSAQKMFDTLAGNDATKIEQAQRNIEVAADGIKGALAGAFSEPLGDFADFVSQNRGPVLQFFSDLVNGAIDFGIGATESFGSFVSGPLADAIDGVAQLLSLWPIGQNTDDLRDLAEDMRGFESNTDDAVAKLEEMRGQFNGFADGQVALGYVNDAALRTADAVSQVGLAADGTRFSIEGLDTANLRSSESGRALDEQLQASAASLDAEYQAALLAGESQENLRGRYDATAGALMSQLTAMGLTQEQAQALIDTVLQTPTEAYTVYSSNAEAEAAVVDKLTQKVVQMPDGSFVVVSDTTPATTSIDTLIASSEKKQIKIRVFADGAGFKLPGGQVVTPGLAAGGPVRGPGGPRDDLVPIWGSNGEHMLTAREVDAAGGHGGVYRLRQALLDGTLHLADGGPVHVPDDAWRVAAPERSAVLSAPAAAAVAPIVHRTVTVHVTVQTAATDGRLIGRQIGREIEQELTAS